MCVRHDTLQYIDHFGWAPPPGGETTYQQRFFVCDEYWRGGDSPIFFYTGNEADVELCMEDGVVSEALM